jgi:hypothetical protein
MADNTLGAEASSQESWASDKDILFSQSLKSDIRHFKNQPLNETVAFAYAYSELPEQSELAPLAFQMPPQNYPESELHNIDKMECHNYFSWPQNHFPGAPQLQLPFQGHSASVIESLGLENCVCDENNFYTQSHRKFVKLKDQLHGEIMVIVDNPINSNVLGALDSLVPSGLGAGTSMPSFDVSIPQLDIFTNAIALSLNSLLQILMCRFCKRPFQKRQDYR